MLFLLSCRVLYDVEVTAVKSAVIELEVTGGDICVTGPGCYPVEITAEALNITAVHADARGGIIVISEGSYRMVECNVSVTGRSVVPCLIYLIVRSGSVTALSAAC